MAGDITLFIRERLDDMNAARIEVTPDPNYTEADGYGDGWEVAQKLFEIGSRSAILKAEGDTGNVRLGEQYNEGKLVHTFLNQWGYTTDKEAEFHFGRAGGQVRGSRGVSPAMTRTLPQAHTIALRPTCKTSTGPK